MNNKIVSSLLVTALLTGCSYNNDNFDGLLKGDHPTDVKKVEYTLTADDYAAIAKNKSNVDMAKADGVEKDLKYVGTNGYFSTAITAEKYMPAFLAAQYFTADDGSSVKVTYAKKVATPDYIKQLNQSALYKLSNDDYKKAWGDKSTLNFFTPAKPAAPYLPALLAANVTDAKEGDLACASYNYSENEPAAVTTAFKEDFETTIKDEDVALENWTNTTVKGTLLWKAKSFDSNLYIQQSAFKHTAGELDSYLISKEIMVEKGMSLTFDALYTNLVAAGGKLSVLISINLTDAKTAEGINAAKWDDVTDKFTIPTSDSSKGDMANANAASLSSYVGKKVRIAFRYQGNGADATTGIRIDNMAISTPGKNTYLMVNTLYAYDGTTWAPYAPKSDVIMLSQADFNLMGSKYDNFSTSMNADNYLPTFLKQQDMYAQEGDVKVPVYKFYNATAKTTSIRADEYIFTNGQFVKNNYMETATDQFVLSAGQWNFDPSTVITLGAKGDAPTSVFYQTITDWVKENKGAEYVTTYGNNDYFYGGSAYNNNFDFCPSAWKGQASAKYGDMSDENLVKLMYERLPEAFLPALQKLHADAKTVSGVKVIYTINFAIYDGKDTLPYTIQYEVTGPGQFTYIDKSLKQI